MQWYLAVLKKYAVFEGRAQRKEFWFFALFNLIITIILSFVDAALGFFHLESGIGLLSGVYTLAVLIPGLAVGVRRLHDTGLRGWWILLWLIPVIGFIVVLVLMVRDSEPGDNAYGPNPKGVMA